MTPGDIVQVVTESPDDDVPDMRGFLGEVVGTTQYPSGMVVDVEFGPASPAPEGFSFLPEHLKVVGSWAPLDALDDPQEPSA
jgi:hypothetical protein